MNIQGKDEDWLLKEFRNLDPEDPRLLDRFFVTAQLLASKPLDCIHKACGSWSAAKGAYRLFSNEKLKSEDIFACHQAETVRRIEEHSLVFAIQDTCLLDYETHTKTKGLGTIARGYGKKDKPGLFIHPTYVITEDAVPLGLLTWKCWARKPIPSRTDYEIGRVNFERETKDKESFKWLEALRETDELVQSAKVVTLADREADMYDFMFEHEKLGRSYVIRNRINRRLDRSKYTKPKMHEMVQRQKPAGFLSVEVSAQPGRAARVAELAIRFMSITTPIRSNVKGGISKNREGLPPSIAFNLIHAIEENPPSEEEQIDWYLMTNEPVSNFNQAVEKINWYKLRWQIETYFRTLKSGCKIENTRLGEASRLQKYNVLMAIVAWRICYITHLARIVPDQPCTEILDDAHWKALYCRTKRTNKIPKKPPTTKEAVTWIAQLGGFLNRKSDGNPGPMSLWRGWQALEEIIPMYLIMNPSLAP
jgi:hypothetical protein